MDPRAEHDRLGMFIGIKTIGKQRHANAAVDRQQVFKPGGGIVIAIGVTLANRQPQVVSRVVGKVQCVGRAALDIAAFPARHAFKGQPANKDFAGDPGARKRQRAGRAAHTGTVEGRRERVAAIKAKAALVGIAAEHLCGNAAFQTVRAITAGHVDLKPGALPKRRCDQPVEAGTPAVIGQHAAADANPAIKARHGGKLHVCSSARLGCGGNTGHRFGPCRRISELRLGLGHLRRQLRNHLVGFLCRCGRCRFVGLYGQIKLRDLCGKHCFVLQQRIDLAFERLIGLRQFLQVCLHGIHFCQNRLDGIFSRHRRRRLHHKHNSRHRNQQARRLRPETHQLEILGSGNRRISCKISVHSPIWR